MHEHRFDQPNNDRIRVDIWTVFTLSKNQQPQWEILMQTSIPVLVSRDHGAQNKSLRNETRANALGRERSESQPYRYKSPLQVNHQLHEPPENGLCEKPRP